MNREALIESKMPLVGRAVGSYLRRKPTFGYLRDDLHSAGTIGLVKALDRFTDAPNAYIMRWILGAISDAVASEQTIEIPATSRRRAERQGKPIAPISVSRLTVDLVDERSGDPLNSVLECCRDDRESQIVRLKAYGYTNREIANRMQLHESRISQLLSDIERRFDADEANSDEPFAATIRMAGTSTRCACGAEVKFSNEDRCEDCWALDQQKYHGRSMRATIDRAA